MGSKTQFSLNKKYTKCPTLFGGFVIAILYVNKKVSTGIAIIIGNMISVIARSLSILFINLILTPKQYLLLRLLF